jgi:hypothetical protein
VGEQNAPGVRALGDGAGDVAGGIVSASVVDESAAAGRHEVRRLRELLDALDTSLR